MTRPIALVLAVLGGLVALVRLLAELVQSGSSYDAGRSVGRLIIGPILVGAIIWWVVWLVRRRQHPGVPFRSSGLIASIGLIALISALTP